MKRFNLRDRLRELENQSPLTDKNLDIICKLIYPFRTLYLDSLGLTLFRAGRK